MRSHRAAVVALRQRYESLPAGSPVRLAKPTSNLFRFRDPLAVPGLDVSGFAEVLDVDPDARTADVGGMTTYEHLLEATLPYGLMPTVVPQLKTITIGGAIAGLGIESTSYRNGLSHESVRELEVLTGDGEVVVARPTGEHAELFRGFPNSYGTLGYTLRCVIDLEPVQPYVRLRHVRFSTAAEATGALAEICASGTYLGQPVDFIDGTVFGPVRLYLTLGAFTDQLPTRSPGSAHSAPVPRGTVPSEYTGRDIYYRSIGVREVDYLSTWDYLWRWDTDWFWCSRPFGVQHPLVRALWPRRYLRSDVYRRLVALDQRRGFSSTVNAALGRPEREKVIQDVEIPVEKVPAFLEFFHDEVGISPVWLCPVLAREQWPLYPLTPGELYVNVGFWAGVPLPAGRSDGYFNRLIEDKVTELGGHKSLYSTAFYPEDEFWRLYNGDAYRRLKKRYDEQDRLPDLYAKCVRNW
ncbi:MAG: FAD-binding oxidoreductase [Sciscionella sp.]|nr:FAD-binding oxidoreductase [Sciscionella sp.]